MQKIQNFKSESLINYIPATLRETANDWYVLFYAFDPKSKSLKRKRIRINRIDGIVERRKFARQLIHKINVKLAEGWNPFIEQEAPKGYVTLIESLDTYLRTKSKELKRIDSIRTYVSHVESLKNYVGNILKNTKLPVISFDAYIAKSYMDYLYNERDVSGRTFNNYKSFAITIWNWLIENMYCKANPFLTIKKKMENNKIRQIIDASTRQKIKNYLIENQRIEFLTMVMLCFHGLIRPKEICMLKPDNFNMSKRIIVLDPRITKDKDNRIVTITNELYDCLQMINIENISADNYIFSTGFKPGKVLKNTRDIGKVWAKIRLALNMPKEYQFYSLKDSGIVQKIRDGISLIDIRDQAGHSSLQQLEEYTIYANPEGSEQIKKKSANF